MQITTYVLLGEGDNFAYTADGAAAQVLAALGGNPTKDHCLVQVTMPATDGSAGTPPTAPAAADADELAAG